MFGTVKKFDEKKGYGFISPDEGEKDVFVHYSNIEANGFKTLKPGQIVEFEITKNDYGRHAEKVRIGRRA